MIDVEAVEVWCEQCSDYVDVEVDDFGDIYCNICDSCVYEFSEE